jgi:putative hydroxymethylpyrimidine transport system permease protein
MMMTVLRGILIFSGLLLFWQLLVSLFNLPPYILPTPYEVIYTWCTHIKLIANESIITITETLLGLCLGILLGSIFALCMAFFRHLSLWMLPILIISQALPTFAIAPLLVIWFGYGIASKIMTTVLMIFFPITSAFYDGLRRTNQGWLDLAKTMNAKKSRIFWFIRIPSALPSLASGIRLATVAAPIGAVIGEWVGASQGLGFLMLNANARLQIDLMFAALFTLIIFSLLLYSIMNFLLRLLVPWQCTQSG